VELTIEITYMGDNHTRENIILSPDEEEVQRMVKKDLFLRLNWTINLKKLVLIKYGILSNMTNTRFGVQSLLLDDLCSFIFTEAGPPSSLHCLWIQDFYLNFSSPFFSSLMETPQIKSYFLSGVRLCYPDYYMRAEDEKSTVENVGGLKKFPRNHQQTILPKLKHARILDCDPDEDQVS